MRSSLERAAACCSGRSKPMRRAASRRACRACRRSRSAVVASDSSSVCEPRMPRLKQPHSDGGQCQVAGCRMLHGSRASQEKPGQACMAGEGEATLC